jgi:hypothetical protein
MITRPDPRELTQGTIFTCAVAENYDDCDVYGLIITARCDVTNSKAPIFSYIPVVPYMDWSKKDAASIIASRVSANCSGELRNIIRSTGLSESILETLSAEAILSVLQGNTSKEGKLKSKKFSENIEKIENFEKYLLTGDHNSAVDIIKNNIKAYQGLVKELVGNTVSDFHYLDQIEFGKKSCGYVALLREIRFMPSRMASRILDGFDFEEYKFLEQSGAGGMRFKSADDYAMPVGLLKSPFIEFLMQRLTNLFARIGVTDLSSERIDALKNAFAESEAV